MSRLALFYLMQRSFSLASLKASFPYILLQADRLKTCLNDVKKLLSATKLKLNPDKTELIIFGSKTQCKKHNKSFPVDIFGNFLSPAEVVRNLGVSFSEFSFLRHAQNIWKSHFAQIWDLKCLRGYLI